MHALMLTYGVPAVRAVEHDELCHELAPAFACVPGLHFKIWLVNRATRRYGAFYLFETKPHFDDFVASELFGSVWSRLELEDVTASDFAIDERPTAVTRGPARLRAAAA